MCVTIFLKRSKTRTSQNPVMLVFPKGDVEKEGGLQSYPLQLGKPTIQYSQCCLLYATCVWDTPYVQLAGESLSTDNTMTTGTQGKGLCVPVPSATVCCATQMALYHQPATTPHCTLTPACLEEMHGAFSVPANTFYKSPRKDNYQRLRVA